MTADPPGPHRPEAPAFRDAGAAQAAGYVLIVAGILVAGRLVLHPLPAGGFEEQAATGLYFLEPFVIANVPAFLWFGWYGLSVGGIARRRERPARTEAGPPPRSAG